LFLCARDENAAFSTQLLRLVAAVSGIAIAACMCAPLFGVRKYGSRQQPNNLRACACRSLPFYRTVSCVPCSVLTPTVHLAHPS